MKNYIDMKSLVNLDNGAENYVVIEQYPDIGYALIYRKSSIQPWVAAWGYKGNGESWGQGHYFSTLTDAMEYIRSVKGYPNWYRMDEIATKALNKIIENDPYDAEDFFRDELGIEFEEAEYFELGETLDMVKGYEEDDDDDDM